MIILSAGAVAPGLKKAIAAFQPQDRAEIKVTFATAPELRRKLNAGETADVVIAPAPVLDEFADSGILTTRRVSLGRIGVGILVRDSAPLPSFGDGGAFTQALLRADRLVYNQASTGSYLDRLFLRLGITDQLAAKLVCYPDFAAVRRHVATGHGNELGFGATTVIIESTDNGVQFAGPLPATLQNYTTYAAAATSSVGTDAGPFLDHLATPAIQSQLQSTGIL